MSGAECFLPFRVQGIMSRGVGVLERVVEHIGVAVQRLGVARLRHERIRLHEAAQCRVVVARPVVQQPRVPVQPLPGVVVAGGRCPRTVAHLPIQQVALAGRQPTCALFRF